MNKIIILISFLLVSISHILFFYFYKKEQIKTPLITKNQALQIELTKVSIQQEEKKEIKQEIKETKKIEEQKVVKEKKSIEKTKKVQEKKEVEKVETTKEQEEIKTTTEELIKPANAPTQTQILTTQEEQNVIDEYGRKLREEINKNKTYPSISKKLKEQGKVIVHFKVDKYGKFDEIRVIVSSNKERLDKAALNALYDTKEFLPFGNKIQKEYLEYNLPLEFILN